MSARKSLLAFVGVAALTASTLAFAPALLQNDAGEDGKALAVDAGALELTPEARANRLAATAALENVPCVVGMAGPFACNNVDLVDVVPTAGFGAGHGSDSWGWTDDDGTEYVIVTSGVGTGFFRLLEDGTTEYLGTAERTDTADRVLWNDVKVVNDHAYITSEDNAFGLQIVDLKQVAELPAIPLGTGRGVIETAGRIIGDGAHNAVAFPERDIIAMSLWRDDTAPEGRPTCASDLALFDVSDGNETDPVRLGCIDVPSGGEGSHDTACFVYAGPDADYNGAGPDRELGTDDDVPASDICLTFQESAGVYAFDVSAVTRDKIVDGPIKMINRWDYDAPYAHQGWFSENHRWIIFGDELDESGALGSGDHLNTATYYIDAEDLDAGNENGEAEFPFPPQFNGDAVKVWTNPNTIAIDHNMYVVGNRVYQANYGAGLRVLEYSDESLEAGGEGAFTEVAYFDTYPGPGPAEFYGAWNTYPFFESGNIVLSDFESGLLILDVTLED